MSDSSGTNSWTLVTPEETAAELLRSHTELAEQHEGSNTSTAEHTGCASSVEGSVMTSELPVDERQVSGEQPSPDAILTPTPITEDPTPITEDPTPITEDHTPITEDHTPSTEDHTPSTEDPTLSTEDHTPINEDHTPINEDHTPITEDPTDDPTPVTTDPTHMTPDPPHTLVTDDPRPPSSLHFPGHSSDGDAHSQSEGLPEGRAPPSPEPDTFSDSYTHISPSPEEPPASMLTPETLGGEELLQEGGATEHQPLEGEGLGQEEEESELSPRVTDLGKQADPTMDSEGWEEKGGQEEKEEEDAGLRKRRTLLTTLERIGRSDEEEDAEEEEESQAPHREEEFSFSLNKCILGAIILLGIGTIFFSEAEYEAYRELRDTQIPVKQEWSNTEGHPSLADDADLLNKLDKGTEPTSDLHAQLQAQREELKVAQGQAMEGAKERLQREVVEEEEKDLPPVINSEVPDPQLKTHGLDSSSATSSSSSSSPSPHPLADGAPPPPDTEAAEPPAGHSGDSSQEAHSRKAEKEKKQKDKKKDKYDTGEKEGKEREKKERKEREKTEKRKEKKDWKEREKRKYEEERGKEGKEWQNKEEKKKQKKEWKEKVEWKKRDDKGKQWKGGEGEKEWEEKRDERKDRKDERKDWKKDKQEKWSNSGKEGRGKEEWKDEKKGRKEHQEWKEERGWKKGGEESGKGGKEKEEKKHWKNRNDRDEEKEWKETNEKKHGGGKGEWKKEERKKEEWRKDGGRFDKDKHDKHHHDNRHGHRDDHHDHRHDDHHGHRDDNVWHAGKGGSSRHPRPSMEHPGYWLHQRHKLQRNVSPPQLRCDSLETCAQAQGLLQPVDKDQFQAVLQVYLAKAEAAGVEASRTEELRKLASEFFPDGVFAHNLMSFRDFTEDVADILEDMVEEEEEEEEKGGEEEEEDSALEQEMDGFEEEVMQRFGVVVVVTGKEGWKGKRGERKMERGRG